MSHAFKIGSHYDQWLEKELSLGRKCSFFILITNFSATKNRRGIPSSSSSSSFSSSQTSLFSTLYKLQTFFYKLEFETKYMMLLHSLILKIIFNRWFTISIFLFIFLYCVLKQMYNTIRDCYQSIWL